MNIETKTFGCRLNIYESEVIRQETKKAELNNKNAVVFNTCAVTNKAVNDAKKEIRRVRRQNPDTKIIVSGCAAQVAPKTFAEMPEVDLVLGNEEKLYARNYEEIPDFGVADSEKIRVNDIMEVRLAATHMVDAIQGHTRGFVHIQNGCDHRCTFCVIPYGRGNSRSVPAGDVVRQTQKLVDGGCREIVLTGVDITSWGNDLPNKPSLGRLVSAILKQVPKLERIRLSSIDSVEVDPMMMDIIVGEKRFMPHLHLSIQSGDNMILKRMKRRHSREDTIRFCQTIKNERPEVVFGADIIAGFPTETPDMFQKSLDIVDEANLTFLHVFPFSQKNGTPAARMPQLNPNVIRERARKLRRKGEQVKSNFFGSRIGKIEQVLVQDNNRGYTEQFAPVSVFGGTKGEIVSAVVEGFDNRTLVAKIVTKTKNAA